MAAALLLLRLVLAAVLAVAGIAKLADRAGARRALGDFGVPARIAGAGAVTLSLAELAIAAALIPDASALAGALAATALLLLFAGALARVLARGEQPDCHCFGQLHSSPAGRATLARNLGLAAAAALVAALGPQGGWGAATRWLTRLDDTAAIALGAGVALAAAVAALAWFCLRLLRQQGRLLQRIETLERRDGAVPRGVPAHVPGLAVGVPAPAFVARELDGRETSRDQLLTEDRPLLLVFSDPACGPCNALLPDVARWQTHHAETMTVALIGRGRLEDNRAKRDEHGLTRVLVEDGASVAGAFGADGTPAAVLLDARGRVASQLARGPAQVRLLAARTIDGELPARAMSAPPAVAPPVAIGDPLPAVGLRDADGRDVELAGPSARPRLVVFWNDGCHHCQRLVPELQTWEADPPEHAPELVLVAMRAGGPRPLRAPLLLDPQGRLMAAVGARATPTALLVGADGCLASLPTIGGAAVLSMARGAAPEPLLEGAAP